jgi:hypothetical protein
LDRLVAGGVRLQFPEESNDGDKMRETKKGKI